jgi:hypothetical protein
MSAVTQTDRGFTFGDPAQGDLAQADQLATERAADVAGFASAHPAGPLGALAPLEGAWRGTGFNTIWRPHHGGQDRFLALNVTRETLVFTKINGPIPNRGFLNPYIEMFGLTYMQQIADSSTGAGLHIEPGIWVNVPPTTNPSEPQTVVRMASIPHGTVILAQGKTQFINGGPPHIPTNNIIPFPIGTAPPSNADFDAAARVFPELDLNIPSAFRFRSPGVTQEMVKNPNSVIEALLPTQTIKNRTFIQISTKHTPIKGGGTANTAFLADAANPPGGNANAVEVDATFWIETVAGEHGAPDRLQLQYTQLVQLDFNGLRWPHVTVATLQKQ